MCQHPQEGKKEGPQRHVGGAQRESRCISLEGWLRALPVCGVVAMKATYSRLVGGKEAHT